MSYVMPRQPFFPKLVDFLSSGAVVAMVWEGNGVVATGRAMIGKTNPLASDSGTIRHVDNSVASCMGSSCQCEPR